MVTDDYSDFDDELNDDDTPQEKVVTIPRAQIRQLEKKAKLADTNESRAAAAERELAFFKAGIPDTPQTQYFRKGYDGETTAEAIRAAATEAGFIQAEPDTPPDEQAKHQQIAAASAGAQVPSNPNLQAEIDAAASPEEVMAILQKGGVPTSYSSQ